MSYKVISAEETAKRNRETSQAEVRAFEARPGSSWFAYMALDGKRITTWTGDTLASVTWSGAEYRCPAFGGFQSVRVNFRARGIDGRDWYGTYYKSSGDYVRMRACKGATQ